MASDPNRVLILAAHPDDEILGCGGTAALHTDAGDEVTSVIVCEGESHRYGESVGMEEHSVRAGNVLGVRDVRFLRFADQHLDEVSLTEIISPIESIVREVQPSVVYCQFGGDVNRDHELLFKAALVATRPTEGSIEVVYAFDTASSTEWGFPRSFVADTWIDISSVLDRKIEAMTCYETELRDYPHPRSSEGLRHRAHAWGNQCLLDAAEVFTTVRRIHRNGQAGI